MLYCICSASYYAQYIGMLCASTDSKNTPQYNVNLKLKTNSLHLMLCTLCLWSLPQGRVGINVDLPPEALSVSGNIHLTGQLLQPSDERIKHSIVQVGSRWVG